MPQLLSLSCVTLFQSRSLALGSGVFARYLEKSVGRRVFCHSFLILFAFQPDFTFYLYCARSHIYWLEPAGSSQRSSKGPCKLFSSQGSCPITAARGPSPITSCFLTGVPKLLTWHAMTWDALGAEGRPRAQHM